MDFSDLFSNGKSGGPGPRRVDWVARLRSTVDRGGVDKRAWCSPSAVEEDEPDEAGPEGCSPEHERRRRGSATEVKKGGGLSSMQGRRKARRSSEERGKRGSEGRGISSPFIGVEGWPGR
jgi:hypothetical protein